MDCWTGEWFGGWKGEWMKYLIHELILCSYRKLVQGEVHHPVVDNLCITHNIINVYSSSIGTTAHCGLCPVEQCPYIFSYLPPTLSIFSLPALEDLFLLPLSIFSWVFPFFSSLPVLECRSFWASYPPPFSLGDLTSFIKVYYSPKYAQIYIKLLRHVSVLIHQLHGVYSCVS